MADGPRAVVLAAGQGTRMKSATPKVLHPLAGRPMLGHVVALARAVTGRDPIVVVNPAHEGVRALLEGSAEIVEQPEPRGTGDAVAAVPTALRDAGTVVVLSGDVPLLRAETVARVVEARERTGADAALLVTLPADPRGLGRIRRGPDGRVAAIVEERDLPAGEPVPAECNAGVYAFRGDRLWAALERVGSENAQGERYLTDVVGLLERVEAVVAPDPLEAMGVNDRVQLAAAEAEMRRRILERHMLAGVTIEDPSTTYVDDEVEIAADSVIRPMTALRGRTVLGTGCEIGPGAQLRDVRAGAGCRVGTAVIEESELAAGVGVGPYCRVRPGSVLGSGVSLGTHAEVKNSTIGEGSRVNHFSCVLDSDVGVGVNIGAGTVTCNYDGGAKHRTVIEDGVFVGSNSTLVAPVRIGRGAYVAAGSLVNVDVPAGALAVGRSKQRNVEGWVERRGRVTAP